MWWQTGYFILFYYICFVAETGLKETERKINEMETSDGEAHNQISSLGDVVQVLQANFSDLNKQVSAGF